MRLQPSVVPALLLLILGTPTSARAGDPPPPPAVDLAIDKQGPAVADPGDNVTYTITVTNVGAVTDVTATLHDQFPDTMAFVSITPSTGCTQGSVTGFGTVDCPLAFDANTTQLVFSLTLTIPANAGPSTAFTDIASVQGASPPDINEENDSSPATTTTPSLDADLAVSKLAPSAVAPGQTLQYDITLTNAGPTAATGVTLTDTLPGDLTFVSLVADPDFSCTTPAVGAVGTVSCTASTMPVGAAGTAQFTLVAQVPNGTNSSSYTNVAMVDSDVDPDPKNDQSSAFTTVSDADLSVQKSANQASVVAGQTIDFTITLANLGPDTATDARFDDLLPAGMTFVSITQDTGPSAACGGSGTTAFCSLALLGSGQSASFTLTAQVAASTPSGTLTNQVTASSGSGDSQPGNNSDSAEVAVTGIADVTVAKTGPPTATPGTDVTYTLLVSNLGGDPATSVSLTDTLPTGVTFVSANGSTPSPSCGHAAGVVTCTWPSLAGGASSTVTIVVHVAPNATGNLTNAASITAGNDANTGNNSSSTTTPLAPSADVGVTKSGPASVPPGSDVPYTITVTNAGPSDAAGVSLTDPLPVGTTFVSLTPQPNGPFTCTTPAVGSGGTVTCNAATFAAGGSAVFTLAVRPVPGFVGAISNTAAVSATTADPNAGNGSASAAVGVGVAIAPLEIPTLSELMLVLLAVALGALGVLWRR